MLPHPPRAGTQSTVLIVAPVTATRVRLHADFCADGQRPLVVATVAEALPMLSTFRCDLVLIATEDGAWDDLERLRAAAGDTPVVILTTAGAVTFTGYRRRGFAGLVTTPADWDDTRTTLAAFLDGKALTPATIVPTAPIAPPTPRLSPIDPA